jgi:hypothetical protein
MDTGYIEWSSLPEDCKPGGGTTTEGNKNTVSTPLEALEIINNNLIALSKQNNIIIELLKARERKNINFDKAVESLGR